NENTMTLKSFYFVIKINAAGQTLWKKKYPRVDGIREINGNLFVTKDNGAALIVNASENGKINPSFIKIDNAGSSSCQDDIIEEIFTNNTYIANNLTWTSRDAGTSGTQTFKSTSHSYDVPVLSLNVRPFCPNEPIDWTFRVSTKGATFYEWSTGDKGPLLDTLRVFKEGEYSVTVTIGESVCYKLCDTSMLTRYEKPKVQLSLGLGTFCTTNNQLLLVGYTPGHPQIKTINWSTGATNVSSIDIAQPGLYKVTLVDGCDESASAEITVGTFPRKITSATIAPQVTVNCLSGSITGTLTATGNSSGLGIERYLWSTGETTRAKSINGSTVRTYTVTVTDACGTSVTANTTIELKGDGIKSVTLVADNSKVCTQKTIELNAITQIVANYTYKWSDGSTQPKLAVTTAGTYTITVTDLCGNTATASGEVKESDLTPKSLEYANVFFPDGVDYRFQGGNSQDTLAFEALKLNRTFGPINRPEYCINQVENYEFYVFNRWGQTVFESKNIQQEWDGLIKESKAQGDTYVYVVKYSILGSSITVKGDVTMIRL
ncbi:MAG: gliding motility-associated C-terminal domain-containing protein, partial [Saprospiraceae bacterium]